MPRCAEPATQSLRARVQFFVPSADLVRRVPDAIADYWSWIDDAIRSSPATLRDGELCVWSGPYDWTIQTFIYLRAAGLQCDLTDSFPNGGLVITHSDFLPSGAMPTDTRFIVEIKPDRLLKNIFSNFVVVQNKRDPIHHALGRLLFRSAFVKFWPQPGLIPRDQGRGDTFENVCYFGNPEQFLTDDRALL